MRNNPIKRMHYFVGRGGGVLYSWNVVMSTSNYVYDALTASVTVLTAGYYRIYANVSVT